MDGVRPRRTFTHRLSGLIADAYAFDDLDEFRLGLLPLLRRAVPTDYAAYNEVDDDPSRTWAIVDPDVLDAELFRVFARYIHQNPLLAHMRATRDGRPRRLSDFLDRDQFHALELYQQLYRQLGVESQLAFTLPSRPPIVIGIALSRGPRDFDDEDVRLLAIARPHLIQAYRAVELATVRARTLAVLENGLDAVANPVLAVERGGRIVFATTSARRLLADHVGFAPDADRLPPELAAWLRDQRADGTPIVLTDGDHRLTARVIGTGDPVLIALEPGSGGMTVAALLGLGLTTREAEVLRWVALGRSGPQAATLLSISPRTVEKHLQNAYAKLGVDSRSQAAATAWAAVGVRHPAI